MVESGVAGNASGAKKAAKAKKPRAKPTHPPTADMVNAAIKALKERGGSSLQAVKKYIASTYKVDVEKQAPFIKKYLKSAVTSGQLVQTKGKGAAGSFRLALGKQDNASKSKAAGKVVQKKATPKKASSSPKKTVKSPKKATIKKKSSSTTVPAKKPSVKSIGEKRKPAALKRPAAKPPKAKTTTSASAKTKTVKSTKSSVKKTTPVKAKARKPVAKKPAATASRKK